MRDIFLYELRGVVADIRVIEETATSLEKEQDRKILLDSIDECMKLARISRTEGLLSVEEYLCQNYKEKDTVKSVVKFLGYLMVDGTDPTILEEISLSRYFSTITDPYESLAVLMYIRGLLAIQNGENETVIRNMLIAMLPFEVIEE